jgi:hypothetical protein
MKYQGGLNEFTTAADDGLDRLERPIDQSIVRKPV